MFLQHLTVEYCSVCVVSSPVLNSRAGPCDIDQVDAGPGGVTIEQFQKHYVQPRFNFPILHAMQLMPLHQPVLQAARAAAQCNVVLACHEVVAEAEL
jgi:hypothetical protein